MRPQIAPTGMTLPDSHASRGQRSREGRETKLVSGLSMSLSARVSFSPSLMLEGADDGAKRKEENLTVVTVLSASQSLCHLLGAETLPSARLL